MKKLIVSIIVLVIGYQVYSQTYNSFEPSKSQFMLRGYGHTGFEYMESGDDKESTFLGAAFAPIFLYKHSDRLMFEAELEFVLEGDELETGLEYANVMYVLNDHATVRAGKFLLPFGTFAERLHPAWINRLPNAPLGYGHDGIAPSSGIGVELRGAFDIGGPKVNYSIYSTNGPRIKDGSEEPEEAGILEFENYEDTNLAKAYGGRIGILPLSDSSAEFGFSAYSTNGTGTKDTEYENVGAFLFALDFSYVKSVTALSGIVDVKAQYNNSNVETATFIEEHSDGDMEEYSFDNQSNTFYTQLSYRPTMAGSDFLKNLEFVGRYSDFNAPEGAEWEEKSTQYAFGLNYWLSWRSVLKLSYQTTETEGGHDGDGVFNSDGLFVHWAIGF